MNGVDISGYDKGIDIASLEADFVIVKATEGTQGTVYNPDYRKMADAVLSTSRCLGFYHYANGGDPIKEADCFYEAIKDYRGRAVAALDWEGQGNPLFGGNENAAWCKRFLDRVRERFGGTPLLYISKSVANERDWSSCREYPLWGAQYPDYEDVRGYQSDPWQSKGQWGVWGDRPTIFQYTSTLVLARNGGIKHFDGDLFYGSRSDWERLCGATRQSNGGAMRYRAHCQTRGWMPWVSDGEVAGTTGQAKRLEAIQLDLPEGVTLKVVLHLQGVGNVTYSNVKAGMAGLTLGSTGDARRVEAITAWVTRNDSPQTSGKSLQYRVHVQTYGWTDWIPAGTLAGTTGQSKRLEAVQFRWV